MKSTWVAAGLLLLTICQAEKDEPTVDISIKTISRNTNNAFYVCLNEYEPSATSYQLSVTVYEGNETNYDAIKPVSDDCLQFQGYEIKGWGTHDITLVLTALNENVVIKTAKLDITSFPEFPPDKLKACRVPDPDDMTGVKYMSRISGDMRDMTEIMELSSKPIISDDRITRYYLDVPDSKSYTPYAVTSNVPPVTICDVEFDVVTPIQPTPKGPTVEKAILSYGYTTEADGAVSAKITVKATSALTNTTSDQLEVIFPKKGANPAKLCAFKNFDEESCDVTWKPSEITATIRVIGVLSKSNEIQETDITPITDRNVGITSFEGIVEGNWLMHKVQMEEQNYKITKKNIDDTPEVDEHIDVDCTSIFISSLCFGYFSTVTAGKNFTITVRNVMGGAPNETDQIESEPVEATQEMSLQDLQIHALPLEWHQNLMEVNTTICFSHETPNEEMIFSHYEMLLINTRGQWLKHKVMEEDDNDDVLCFTPFTINTQELDVTEGVKVVVSQRASDCFSVIASGGSPLF